MAVGACTVALLSVVGCQWSENRFLDREVTPQEVVGEWVLRAESVQDLNSVGVHLKRDRSSYKIDVQPEGNCDLRTFLPEALDTTGRPPTVTSSRCRWSLTNDGRHQQLSIELLDPPGKTTWYNFTALKDGGFALWQYIGDPDAWKYLEYSKAGS